MKLALINPFRFQEKLVKKNEPVSLGYLKSFLENRGHVVKIFDYEIIDDNQTACLIGYIASKFDAVGISCYFPYLPLELATSIKRMSDSITVIAGGPMASLKYKELLYDGSPINYIIVNEGEQSLYELLEELQNRKSPYNIPGVACFYNDVLYFKHRSFVKNLDDIEFPIREKEFYKNYIPSIVSSRGCNGRCSFCSTRYMGKWRGRSPEHVVKEIQHIVNDHNETHFQFVDPNFFEDPDRAVEIAKLIRTLPHKLSFDFACRIDSIVGNKDKLLKLKNAGATKVLLGIENFEDETLNCWHKDINLEQIRSAIKILDEIELNYSVSLILFHPTVTKNELIMNVKVIEELDLVDKIENIFNYLRLIPGTLMNPSTCFKEWSFVDKEITQILNKCLDYSEKNKKKLFIADLKPQNTSDYIDNLTKTLIQASTIKKSKLRFLKKELGIEEEYKDTDFCKTDKLNTIVFKINPDINIESSELVNKYKCFDTRTGLQYSLNKLAMILINISNGNTLEDLVKSIIEEHKNESVICAQDLFEGLVSLVTNRILILEVT